MTIYSEQTSLTLLTGATDADGDPVTVRRINGVAIGSWPHVLALPVGSISIAQTGLVTYDDAGDISGHPADGVTAANGTFTFTLWDGVDESPAYLVDVNLIGQTPPPSGLTYGQNNPVGPVTGNIWVDVNATGANNGSSLADAFTSIQAAVNAASPGDVIVVKGGKYRESIDLHGRPYSGQGGISGNPITLTRYGTETVTVTGAEPLTGWSPCTDQADAGGSPNWASMYKCFVPAGLASAVHPLHYNLNQSGQMMMLTATGPGYKTGGVLDTNKLFSNRNTAYFRNGGTPSATSWADSETTDGLGQFTADSDLDEAWIAIHHNTGNNVVIRDVTGFSAASDTVSFASYGGGDIASEYSVQNVPKLIQAPGQWAFRKAAEGNGTRKLWCWPYDNTKMGEIEISQRGYGIDVGDSDYWTVYGIDCVQFAGGPVGAGNFIRDGMGIGSYTNQTNANNGIIIEQCRIADVLNTRDDGGMNAIALETAVNCTILNTTVYRAQNMHGVSVTRSATNDIRIEMNLIRACGGTGIRPHNLTNFIVAFNRVDQIVGPHSNGMSVYQGADLGLIFGNVIRSEQGIGFTHQESGRLYFLFNDIQAPLLEPFGHRGLENNGTNPAPTPGNTIVLNCTVGPAPGVLLTDSHDVLITGKTGNQTHHCVNCVAHGGLGYELYNHGSGSVKGSYTNNMLSGLRTGQTGVSSPMSVDPNTTLNTNVAQLWVNYMSEDYRPVPLGPLDGAGDSAAALRAIVAADFPGFNIDRDVLGKAVSWVSPPIGAYLAN